MVTIHLDKIKVKTLENESGVFTGNNYAQNWSYISKQNTNISGNHVSNNSNIVIDKDDVDYVVFDNKNVKQVGDDTKNMWSRQKKTVKEPEKKSRQSMQSIKPEQKQSIKKITQMKNTHQRIAPKRRNKKMRKNEFSLQHKSNMS